MADFLRNAIYHPLPINFDTPAWDTNFVFDSATKQMAFIFSAGTTAPITTVGFNLASKTGAPGTLKAGIQGVTDAGAPDGTFKGGGSQASHTFAAADVAAGFCWITLDNAYTPATRGEMLAFVIVTGTGTYDGGNKYTINDRVTGLIGPRANVPYACSGDGVWTNLATYPVFGYKDAGSVYGFPLQTWNLGTAYSSNSSPNEYGMQFTLDSNWGGTYQVVGVRWVGTMAATGKTGTLRLATAIGGTEIQAITIKSGQCAFKESGYRYHEFYFDEASLTPLTFGTAYVIALEATSLSAGFGMPYLLFSAAADLAALSGGINVAYAYRYIGSGDYSIVTARRPLMELIIADWTQTAGGSGGGLPIVGGSIVR